MLKNEFQNASAAVFSIRSGAQAHPGARTERWLYHLTHEGAMAQMLDVILAFGEDDNTCHS